MEVGFKGIWPGSSISSTTILFDLSGPSTCQGTMVFMAIVVEATFPGWTN